MAKKLRRDKSTSKNSLFAWPKVLIVIIPLFAALLIMFNSPNGRSVLGVSDTNMLNLNHEKTTASQSGDIHPGQSNNRKCKPNRVSTFSLTSLCSSGNGFKQYSYTCENGTFATVTKTCINSQAAFEAAMKACAKARACEKPTLSPKPTQIPHPSGVTEK